MIIYKITNKVNGKFYIGQTAKTAEQRLKNHINHSRSCNTKFYKAIQKYGPECFEVKVLIRCKTREQLNFYEPLWIKKLDAINSGYNSAHRFGVVAESSPETRKKQSENSKRIFPNGPFFGKKHSDHTKKILSKRNKGMVFSEERRKKYLESWKNSKFPELAKIRSKEVCSKPIQCLDSGAIFDTVTAAANFLGTSSSNVSKQLKGKIRHVKGRRFVYLKNKEVFE